MTILAGKTALITGAAGAQGADGSLPCTPFT